MLGFVHARGSWWTRDRHAALEYLLALQERYGAIQVWATNLEYDAANLWGSDRIREVTLRFGRSHLYGARWRKIEFRDTVRHIPASVKQLGELVGMPKLKRSQEAAYMLRDGAITYRSAKLIRQVYRKFDEYPRMTLPATAFRIWQEHFFGEKVFQVPDEVWEAAKHAYHGGRTEPFAAGSFKEVSAIDASSMFPWAMTQEPFPIAWGPFERSDAIHSTGLYDVTVDSALDLPVLPVRTDRGTIYPNGRWRSWYVGHELLRFKECGGHVKVHDGYVWSFHCRPFDSYVAAMFKLKQTTRGPMRHVYKLILNSLYGKFGQSGFRVEVKPIEELHKMKHPPIDFHVWNGLAFWSVEGKPPPWGNNIWAALVTARARVRLHRELVKVRESGRQLLYCDTDSVIFAGRSMRYPAKAARPGDFETRGRFRSALIVGKKEYGLEKSPGVWEIHVKGVPAEHRESYLHTGQATYSLPNRLRESARRDLKPNVWRERTKRRKVTLDHRARQVDGSLIPMEFHQR